MSFVMFEEFFLIGEKFLTDATHDWMRILCSLTKINLADINGYNNLMMRGIISVRVTYFVISETKDRTK